LICPYRALVFLHRHLGQASNAATLWVAIASAVIALVTLLIALFALYRQRPWLGVRSEVAHKIEADEWTPVQVMIYAINRTAGPATVFEVRIACTADRPGQGRSLPVASLRIPPDLLVGQGPAMPHALTSGSDLARWTVDPGVVETFAAGVDVCPEVEYFGPLRWWRRSVHPRADRPSPRNPKNWLAYWRWVRGNDHHARVVRGNALRLGRTPVQGVTLAGVELPPAG
jgi:hypothetical protein